MCFVRSVSFLLCFFFNVHATTEIYPYCHTLSRHDALPISIANDVEFGLSAGIVTASLRHAHDFMARAQAGMVMVNLPTAGVDYHIPFGGTKASSLGPREQGFAAVDFYTQTKTSYLAF